VIAKKKKNYAQKDTYTNDIKVFDKILITNPLEHPGLEKKMKI
jgi:hypothetical protein